jgi:type IX secretion system PorP/SprF family membrane protein
MRKYIKTILLMIAVLMGEKVSAQISPMKSQYFQNPYLVNAAMAGYNGKLNVFANYSNQWNRIDGSPILMSFSAAGRLTEKAAVGFNYMSDKAGLLRRSQAMGSYAYKVNLNDEQSLRFGVSLSWAQNRFDQGDATSNGNLDPAFAFYNNQRDYLDGNFGAAYISKRFEAQFSYLNLNNKRQNQFSAVNYATFYSALSYRIDLVNDGSLMLKPLIAYRGVKGFENQWDVATELSIEQLKLYTMYHSNKSFTGGFGFLHQKKLLLSIMYSTEPQGLQGLTGGQFDLVMGYQF